MLFLHRHLSNAHSDQKRSLAEGLTDGDESRLRFIGVCDITVVAGDQPVERERDILSAPVVTSCTPPTVVDVYMLLTGEVRWVLHVGEVQHHLVRVGMEEV